MQHSFIFLHLVVIFTLSLAIRNSEPPKQDECQAINATEPSECPQVIGPPCPPCINNTLPDYEPGDNAAIPNSIKSIISMLIDDYTRFWLDNYGPNVTNPNSSNLDASTWVAGAAGRAQLFLRYVYCTFQTFFDLDVT